MNEIKIFRNNQFGEIRTLDIDGEPWFVGKDVTEALGYSNASKALLDHVDEDDKLNNESLSSLGQRGGWIINESGLYSLILSSKLESAKAFKRWITSEVIPSIRKHGGYLAGQETMSDEELMAKALEVAHRTLASREQRIQALEAKIESDRPKVLFASAVSASNTRILVGELAKILRQNGIDIGQNRLFRILRNEGYLIKRKGTDYNMPTQKSMDNDWMEIVERTGTKKDGTTVVYKTPYVTGKGQIYFVEKFLGKKSN